MFGATAITTTALTVVPTPIGDLEDITLRALRVLKEADMILVEDARTTNALLAHYEITTPLLRYDPQRIATTLDEIEAQWNEGKSLALVCDAGTPTLADPGRGVIQRAHRLGVKVTVLPGANAAITALVLSGLSSGQFVFLGFPPRTQVENARFFEELARETRTLILYETYSRLASTLKALQDSLGAKRSAALACNLTKPDEWLLRDTLGEIAEQVAKRRRKGEYVIIVEGIRPSNAELKE